MSQPKPSLLEMRDLVAAMLNREQASMQARSVANKRLTSDADERRIVVFRALLVLLSVLATYEDRARSFVGWLMREHATHPESPLNLDADPFLVFGKLHEASPEGFQRIAAAARDELAKQAAGSKAA